jgi:hypothetical protein
MKFSGEAVAEGIIGANAAGTALLGFDECLRYFSKKQSPALARLEYEIPVKTTEGSWIVWVLGTLGSGTAIFAGAYLKKAAEKMAENDFKDIGLKDVLRKSVDALKHFIDVTKHTKGNTDWASAELNWRVSNGLVGIANGDGEVIYVPIEYFRWYLDIPRDMFKKFTNAINAGRSLTIGVNKESRYETSTITEEEKGYFGHEVDDDNGEFLFPELEHGDHVRLEGHLTRGNENSNSVGLEYKGHVLNCVPESGSIRRYKPALFLHCIVEGTVSRLFKQSNFAERRPTIIFTSITPLESDEQIELF